ncbi:hypothetical protein A4A49_52063 [Nicotiana attenuata]|uniref:Uncharacterized protein n=1 Tax=Nicotiana attenuata TaxID=49451 RepID=A0A314KXY8_NICAT|nr:hypothetical protein A4A49_52063 [Nicotiana attenuata]
MGCMFQGALWFRGTEKGDLICWKEFLNINGVVLIPVKPSYSFFVMAIILPTWSKVKHSSFGETSKRLSKKWSKFSRGQKKVIQDMASKDDLRLRYRRQCILLRNDARKWQESQMITTPM